MLCGKPFRKVTEYVRFEVKTASAESFDFPIKICFCCGRGEITLRYTQFAVDGRLLDVGIGETTEENGQFCNEQRIRLGGKTSYRVEYTREKVYNVGHDYYIGLRARYIISGLRVTLHHPTDIEVAFICRGTQNDFDDIRQTHPETTVSKQYKGIVLPRQGYIFVLKPID